MFDNQVRERFVVFWLSTANIVTGFEIISEGTLTSSVIHTREVFRGSIVASCANIILAHNHPSGNPEPSREDINITMKLVEAGNIIDIKVYDHIIFAENEYTSLVESRLM